MIDRPDHRTHRGLDRILAGILADAAVLLELEGWRPPDPPGPGLSISGPDGAIARAAGGRPPPGFRLSLAEQAHWALERHVHRLVSGWEQEPARSGTEVIATVRACAKSLRSAA